MKYLCLLRGVNVGGKNKVSMADLKIALETDGFDEVATYINSGNVIISTTLKTVSQVERAVEAIITKTFKLDSELIKVRALTPHDFQKIVGNAPEGFGTEPTKYHSDVLFTMGIDSSDIMAILTTHPEVDTAWEGDGVVYFRRLSARRTSSRLGRITEHPHVYKNITIRSWNTTVKLLNLL